MQDLIVEMVDPNFFSSSKKKRPGKKESVITSSEVSVTETQADMLVVSNQTSSVKLDEQRAQSRGHGFSSTMLSGNVKPAS